MYSLFEEILEPVDNLLEESFKLINECKLFDCCAANVASVVAVSIGMTCCRDNVLSGDYGSANRALNAVGETGFGAGRSFSGYCNGSVTESRNDVSVFGYITT